MRGVSKGVRRSAAILALLTILVAQSAAASDREAGRGLFEQLDRAKRFVVTALSRIGLPPG